MCDLQRSFQFSEGFLDFVFLLLNVFLLCIEQLDHIIPEGSFLDEFVELFHQWFSNRSMHPVPVIVVLPFLQTVG